jgi:hypothetical protein
LRHIRRRFGLSCLKQTSFRHFRCTAYRTISAGLRKVPLRECLATPEAQVWALSCARNFSDSQHGTHNRTGLPKIITMVTEETTAGNQLTLGGRGGTHAPVCTVSGAVPQTAGMDGQVTEFRRTLNLKCGWETGGSGDTYGCHKSLRLVHKISNPVIWLSQAPAATGGPCEDRGNLP